jgi:hypothetical protein
MDRIERDQRVERLQQLGRQPLGRNMVRAAVNHAVADRAQPFMPRCSIDHCQQGVEQTGKRRSIAEGPMPVGNHATRLIVRDKMRGALHLGYFAAYQDQQCWHACE